MSAHVGGMGADQERAREAGSRCLDVSRVRLEICLGAEFDGTTRTVPEETVHRSAVLAVRTPAVLEAAPGERTQLSGR